MDDAESDPIKMELSPGERMLWMGKPATGLRLRGSDAFMIPFSLFWGGFAIFWESTAVTQVQKAGAAAYVFPLFGVPFVIIGLYLIVGRFFYDAVSREHRDYAITNQRAIIKSGIVYKRVTTINLAALSEISFIEKSDGSGTITFGAPQTNWRPSGVSFGARRNALQPPAFEMIGNVRSVYALIQNVQRNRA